MKVALVHDWLTGMRGGERCLEALCELFPQADLYTLIYVPSHISPTIRAMRVHASWLNRLPRIQSYYRYCLPLFPSVIERFDLRDYDLVISSSHCVAKGIFPHRALHVSYIHAPMRYIWDQHAVYFSADSAWWTRAGMALWRRYLQQWDVRSSERVDVFVANSRNIAGKIKNLYGRDAAVIHPPIDIARFFISKNPASFYLIVSALVPYKRIDIAIEAFNELQLPLKIAGDGPVRKRLEKMAKPNIEFLGWINDQTLPELYTSCRALIFPGEEDFGIAPVEAQASGRPVIAYGKGGVRETVSPLERKHGMVADGLAPPTGIFFGEPTAESLIEAVCAFQEHERLFDPQAVRRNVSSFSREVFKTQIKELVGQSLDEKMSASSNAKTI